MQVRWSAAAYETDAVGFSWSDLQSALFTGLEHDARTSILRFLRLSDLRMLTERIALEFEPVRDRCYGEAVRNGWIRSIEQAGQTRRIPADHCPGCGVATSFSRELGGPPTCRRCYTLFGNLDDMTPGAPKLDWPAYADDSSVRELHEAGARIARDLDTLAPAAVELGWFGGVGVDLDELEARQRRLEDAVRTGEYFEVIRL